MNTNFFEMIAGLNIPGNWKISIQTNDNSNFIVSALFTANHCGDMAAKKIPPMLLKGTASELGQGFFEAIAEPVQTTAGLYNNMEAYLKEVEQARLTSKQEQDKKLKEKQTSAGTVKKTGDVEMPEPKVDKEEKKRLYTEAMSRVNELMNTCKYAEALEILPKTEDFPEKADELKKKSADLTRMRDQYQNALSIFNA
jgi:PRTRC genetic system protein E